MNRRLNVADLQQKVDSGEKLAAVAVSDFTQARLADEAGMDILLVNDTLAAHALGYEHSMSLTIEQMIYHCSAVVRGTKRALVAAELPFGSYHFLDDDVIENVLRLLKEGGCGAVMLSGGQELPPLVARLAKARVPVIAQIGLQPAVDGLWTSAPYRGLDESAAWELVNTAQELEEAGAFMLMMNCVTAEAAALISNKIDIPTLGSGCGPGCDGQVLCFNDLLGISEKAPWYAQSFISGGEMLRQGLQAYAQAIREGVFPQPKHTALMEEDEAKRLY